MHAVCHACQVDVTCSSRELAIRTARVDLYSEAIVLSDGKATGKETTQPFMGDIDNYAHSLIWHNLSIIPGEAQVDTSNCPHIYGKFQPIQRPTENLQLVCRSITNIFGSFA